MSQEDIEDKIVVADENETEVKEDNDFKGDDGSSLVPAPIDTSSLKAVFDETDLSEEAKDKIITIFKAAVNEAADRKAEDAIAEAVFDLKLAQAEINEDLESREAALALRESTLVESLNEAAEEQSELLESRLDTYLDYVVENWFEENRIAIESGVRVEIAESLISNLRDTFFEHSLELPEGSETNILESLEDELAEAKDTAQTAMSESIEKSGIIADLKAKLAFAEVAEGLTDIEKDRLAKLSEDVQIDDVEKYIKDVSLIRESFIDNKVSMISENSLSDTVENVSLTEEAKTTPAPKGDDIASRYAADMRAALNRF